ncbi:hypothetical protein [Paracoccus yeei]|uniref:hypothetical protein n=1 Tax=Paracoccus yeei TaxID=147645 RepID=UPI0017492935|nr:hypothetical protein [Paracoccus yeei]
MGDAPPLRRPAGRRADPALPAEAAEVRDDPAPAGEALASRADALSRRGGGAPGATDDLARRADALRARAEALSRRSLDDCPDGAETCDAATDTDPTESP